MTMSERWLTFDCYGTMIDWRTGMTEALESVAPGRSADLIDAYFRFEPQVEAEGPFRDYDAVLTEGLRRAAYSIDVSLANDQFDVLAATLPTWQAFPDSIAALRRLRDTGYKLGILTNTSIEMIRGTLAGPLPVPFDEVITAEEVRSYKPGDGHFDEFLARHAPGPRDWIHIGNSVWHDCEPAHKRGYRTVFVHRSDAPENNEWFDIADRSDSMKHGGCPTLVVPDLAGLPAALQELP
ncbi:HAD hydrolase-like protein [Actinomadura madurae]